MLKFVAHRERSVEKNSLICTEKQRLLTVKKHEGPLVPFGQDIEYLVLRLEVHKVAIRPSRFECYL